MKLSSIRGKLASFRAWPGARCPFVVCLEHSRGVLESQFGGLSFQEVGFPLLKLKNKKTRLAFLCLAHFIKIPLGHLTI